MPLKYPINSGISVGSSRAWKRKSGLEKCVMIIITSTSVIALVTLTSITKDANLSHGPTYFKWQKEKELAILKKSLKLKRKTINLTEPQPANNSKFGLKDIAERGLRHDLMQMEDRILQMRGERRIIELNKMCLGMEFKPRTSKELSVCVYKHEMFCRRKFVEKLCSQRGHHSKSNASNFLVLKSRELIWCPDWHLLHQSSSLTTQWLKNYVKLSNFSPAQKQVLEEGLRSDEERAKFVSVKNISQNRLLSWKNEGKFVSFIFVQHPLERLVEFYRQKLIKDATHVGSFKKFLKKIVNKMEHLPTIVESCGLCDMDFDFIIKSENAAKEDDFLVDILELNDKISKLHSNKGSITTNLKPSKFASYYDDVTTADMQLIYQIFAKDFQFFQYDMTME